METKFAIVEFTESEPKEVELVPVKWLSPERTTCAWPPYKTMANLKAAVMSEEGPKPNWTIYKSRVIFEGEKYHLVRDKLAAAKFTSDLQSDSGEPLLKRRKKSNPRYWSDSSDCDSDTPSAPPPSVPVPEPGTVMPIGQLQSTSTPDASPTLPIFPVTPIHNPQPCTVSSTNLKIISLLEDIKAQVMVNRKAIHQLRQEVQVNGQNSTSEEIQLADFFPLGDMGASDSLQEELLKDQPLQNRITNELSLLGGNSIRDSTFRLMRAIFSNDMAKTMNWSGKGGKYGFEKLVFRKIVARCVRRYHPSSSEKDVELAVKCWLKNAKDREGGRKSRAPAVPVEPVGDQTSI